MLKILHTIASLNLSAGGPTSSTYNLVSILNELKCPTDILTISPQQGDILIGTDPFIQTVPYDLKTPLGISRSCRAWLDQHRNYDLYHTNGLWIDINHATCTQARHAEKPYIISLHGMLYPQALQRSAWRKKLMLFLGHRYDLNHAACIHATCRQELKYYRELGFTNQVAVIPNPFPIPPYIQEIRRSPNRFRIGYLGRIHPYKNIDRLIDAWAQLGSLVHDGELLIMGTGHSHYVQQLKDRAASLQINNIRFLGEVSGRKKFEQLASLSALCLPSRSENFGMVVPEALITGTPVIATNTSPWEELHTHHCGWWCNNSVSTLASTMEEVLNLTPEQSLVMGNNGRNLIKETYAANHVAAKMQQLYQYLLGRESKPGFIDIL